ncbi:MAG: T9SS type A sorting domain-containing protein [candidate division Zixibacteria bacterium]|nr:T9SS type A sorting domain-containing protein [candidate division Zixibacteria bacterium]
MYDPDADPLTVTSTVGTVILVNSTPEGDGMIYTYAIDFDMENFCGTCLTENVIVTVDDDNNHDPISFDAGPLTIVGDIAASMVDSLYIWPGLEEWMPVYLDACGDCFCLGGFVFSFEYDASILSITDVVAGAAIAGGEYWNVNYDVDGPGTISITFINDLDNQTPVDDICVIDPDDPLFEMKFLLDAGYDYPTNFCTPVCFIDEGYQYNNVSDKDGYHIWMPDGCDDAPDSVQYGTMQLTLDCGNIKVLNEHNIVLGDLNLNGFPYEVGDIVLLANHLIDPVLFPFNLRQMFASDVNGDDLQATIGDLIYMIVVITGGNPAAKVVPSDALAVVSTRRDNPDEIEVSVVTDASLGGALIKLHHPDIELGAPVAEGVDIKYTDDNDIMTVLAYSPDGTTLASGNNVLFTVPADGEGALSIEEASLSDNRGALLDARIDRADVIPIDFSLNQNYPNPFNASTTINYQLPRSADVTIEIFDLLGRRVTTLVNEQLLAGSYHVIWHADNISSGIYFYKLRAGDYIETRKMLLVN